MSIDIKYLSRIDIDREEFFFKDSRLMCKKFDEEREVLTLLEFDTKFRVNLLKKDKVYKYFLVSDANHKLLIANLVTEQQAKDLSFIEKDIMKIASSATAYGASDIHFIREDRICKIKFRVNGTMIDYREILSSEADALMFVLYNVMATTKETTWNRKLPQDANIILVINEKAYRFRYAHMPLFGEGGKNYHAVVRIIYPSNNFVCTNYQDIGYNEADTDAIARILNTSYGLFIVSGTTGSGKSTSLKKYIELLFFNKYKGKGCFVTVEDPVEYLISGAQQSSIVADNDDKTKNPFADAVRSAMRRDPDVIMIGEIRDKPTVEALSSAVESGHYCLTTIHAGSVVSVLQRLSGLGMKADKIASPGFLAGITSQKLIPELCPSCKVSFVDERYQRAVFSANENGCEACNHSGFKGRLLLLETLVPTVEDLELVASENWVSLYRKYRERRFIKTGKKGLGEGFSIKDKAYYNVLKGKVCHEYFMLHFGQLD
ncbi:toxin-coregulated pilus assembly ATPase TcpT, partial [Vibrio cholerae]